MDGGEGGNMWLPSNATELGLVVATIGLAGGLTGAILGFASNFINTSRQIARQERDRRREVYARVISTSVHLIAEFRQTCALKDRAAAVASKAQAHDASLEESKVSLDLLGKEIEEGQKAAEEHRAEFEEKENEGYENFDVLTPLVERIRGKCPPNGRRNAVVR
jgi:ABC-type multidrug transport system fused ATPase/permease subunit